MSDLKDSGSLLIEPYFDIRSLRMLFENAPAAPRFAKFRKSLNSALEIFSMPLQANIAMFWICCGLKNPQANMFIKNKSSELVPGLFSSSFCCSLCLWPPLLLVFGLESSIAQAFTTDQFLLKIWASVDTHTHTHQAPQYIPNQIIFSSVLIFVWNMKGYRETFEMQSKQTLKVISLCQICYWNFWSLCHLKVKASK